MLILWAISEDECLCEGIFRNISKNRRRIVFQLKENYKQTPLSFLFQHVRLLVPEYFVEEDSRQTTTVLTNRRMLHCTVIVLHLLQQG